jgi:hypothetical protein
MIWASDWWYDGITITMIKYAYTICKDIYSMNHNYGPMGYQNIEKNMPGDYVVG